VDPGALLGAFTGALASHHPQALAAAEAARRAKAKARAEAEAASEAEAKAKAARRALWSGGAVEGATSTGAGGGSAMFSFGF
jgi:hypothetical protein